MMSSEQKIAVLGAPSVGKSAYIDKLMTGEFQPSTDTCVGVCDYPTKKQTTPIHLMEHRDLPSDIDDYDGAIILYCDQKSLVYAEGLLLNLHIPRVLVMSKADLCHTPWPEVTTLVRDNECIHTYLSSLSGFGLGDELHRLVELNGDLNQYLSWNGSH